MNASHRRIRPIVAVHSWSFPHLDLFGACIHAAALGYEALDLGSGELGEEAGLDVTSIIADDHFSDRARRTSSQTGILFSDYFAVLPHPINDPNPAKRAENRETFDMLLPKLIAAGVPGVTLSPGFSDDQPGESFDRAVAALREFVAIANARLDVRIEPHVDSVANTPDLTLDLLNAVSGLTLTLDYSHFIFAGHAADEIEPLHSFASHVHIRQARPGQLAAEVICGTIDVRRLIGRLLHDGYRGAITVEYVSSPWHAQDRVDVDRENAAMLSEVRSILAELERPETDQQS